MRDGREPVSDDDDRLALHHFFERLLDRLLGDRVQARGRLVQNENRRILQHHARNRDPLALPARKLHAALTDQRGVLVLDSGDELVRVRLARRLDHLLVGRLQPAVADVLEQAAMKQIRILRNQAQLRSAATPASSRGYRCPSIRICPALRIVQAQDEAHESRFARAGVTRPARRAGRPGS